MEQPQETIAQLLFDPASQVSQRNEGNIWSFLETRFAKQGLYLVCIHSPKCYFTIVFGKFFPKTYTRETAFLWVIALLWAIQGRSKNFMQKSSS